MGGPHRARLKAGKRAQRPYRPIPDARVLAAQQRRGRKLDTKIDKCRGCLHFLPPNYCPIHRGYTTAEGSCAWHEAAASEMDLEQ